MASTITLPELGENLTGGEVLEVKVSPGDTVSEGQTLLEIEAEKSTVEVPAPVAGRVAEVLVKKGDSVQVGQKLCIIEGTNGAKDERAKATAVREPAQASIPRERQRVAERADGKEEKLAREPAKPVAQPEGDGQRKSRQPPSAEPAEPATAEVAPAGPATRRLARELGIDLRRVEGSAAGGRITQEDVKAFVRHLASGTAGREQGMAVPPLPDFERWGPVERQPLEPVRRRMAEQMSLAWRMIPHVTHYDQADITDLDAFRRQQEKKGPKLTVTAFALKAAAVALKQMPQFNASLDSGSQQLVLKRYCHIGVAVDTERGLLVPVVRDVDKKSVNELANDLAELADRARQKKLQADEMRGGTFTITNLGGIGGVGFSPIVNWPEVAILALSRARVQPVVRDGAIVPRLILPLSVSYDHRVIDGAAAARFTRHIAEMLEDPRLMLL
jgi:pyruvate dehydrogenase E2 component (dihydrolipoamide acetyltransferase)